jgi:hypothetical protein
LRRRFFQRGIDSRSERAFDLAAEQVERRGGGVRTHPLPEPASQLLLEAAKRRTHALVLWRGARQPDVTQRTARVGRLPARLHDFLVDGGTGVRHPTRIPRRQKPSERSIEHVTQFVFGRRPSAVRRIAQAVFHRNGIVVPVVPRAERGALRSGRRKDRIEVAGRQPPRQRPPAVAIAEKHQQVEVR